jgi:tRNA-splicing ligase RtcB
MTAYPAVSVDSLVREIPVTARPDMRVPVRVYADDQLWQQIVDDRSLEQAVNVATPFPA